MVLIVGLTGIYSLRMLNQFRTLIKTMVACIHEMAYFIVLLALIVLLFAIMNFSVENISFNERNFFENMGVKYRSVFNDSDDFEYSRYGAIKWVIYYLFTILVHTVMLNLLIKLVGDTYMAVQANEKSAEAKVQIQMLTEIGLLKRLIKSKFSSSKDKENQEANENKVYFVHRFSETSLCDDIGLNDNSTNVNASKYAD